MDRQQFPCQTMLQYSWQIWCWMKKQEVKMEVTIYPKPKKHRKLKLNKKVDELSSDRNDALDRKEQRSALFA